MSRPDLCAEHGHPPVTYNPWFDQTWCLCGSVIRDGNVVAVPHVACCGGPLTGTEQVRCPRYLCHTRDMSTATVIIKNRTYTFTAEGAEERSAVSTIGSLTNSRGGFAGCISYAQRTAQPRRAA